MSRWRGYFQEIHVENENDSEAELEHEDTFNVEEVKQEIMKLKKGKAARHDQIRHIWYFKKHEWKGKKEVNEDN